MATGNLGTDCSVILGNTGVTGCPYDLKNIVGIMLVPTGTSWTPTQVAAWQSTVAAGVANNTATSRYFPIQGFEAVEDKSGDAVTRETGYRVEKYVSNGKYKWRLFYSNGAMDMHAQLSLFTGQQDRFDVLLIDGLNNGFLCTSSGATNVKGFTLDTLFAPNIKVNTGAEDTLYAIEIGLQDESEINKNWRFIQVPSTINVTTNTSFLGLKPTRIEIVTEMVASTKTVVCRVWSGSTNLYDTYTSELATTALWNFYKDSTGIQNTTASVTAAPATKAWTIVLTSAITAADSFTLQFGTVTALTSAGILRQANAVAQTIAT
jgi:hypothetical protein